MSDFLSLHQDAEGLVLRYLKKPTPDLKDLIMVQYGNMVERIARKFAGIEPFEDLVQVGFIGLLNALTKFDPEAGVRFNTYATYLVAGEMKHYLRDRAQTIRHPAWLQELRHKVNKAAQMLQQSLGRTPTEREIADEVGVSESAVKEVFQTQEMLRVASLDQAAQGDDESSSEVEKLDAAQFCPEQLSVEDRVVLEHAMKQLARHYEVTPTALAIQVLSSFGVLGGRWPLREGAWEFWARSAGWTAPPMDISITPPEAG